MGIQVTPEENIVFIVTNGDDTSIQHWEINIDQENIGTNLQHLDTNNYRKNELEGKILGTFFSKYKNKPREWIL